MSDRSEDIYAELQNISVQLGDLNAIRNGEYDPPTGSGSSGREMDSQATPNDLASYLARIADATEESASDLRLIRLAIYGQTSAESGEPYEEPKHGDWGVVATSSSQLESYLATIDDSLRRNA